MDGFTNPVTCTHALHAGLLTLSISHQSQDGLFQIAERENPKRAFLFVSRVLGRHIPVDPANHRAVLSALVERILPHIGVGSVLVMSYAETAIGLGLGVFDLLAPRVPSQRVGYLPTTRFRPENLSPWFATREEHSHAVDHMIFRPLPEVLPDGHDMSLVLVDDETSTGNTFAGLAESLERQGLEPARVVLVTLTDWSDSKSTGIVSKIFPRAQVTAVSLLVGAYFWEPAQGAALRALPVGCAPECPRWTPAVDAAFGVPRMGISAEAHRAEVAEWRSLVDGQIIGRIAPGARVLVIGSGEHVWHPFLAAEQIAQAGYTTRFLATTRSPVVRGPVVRHQITFPDHYGIGLTMYLNNVQPEAWDEILLFTETNLDGIPNTLRTALGKGWIIAADGITPMTGETS
jgi:hypothetical protein